MAKLGGNMIRIPFNYRHFEPEEQPFECLRDRFTCLGQTMDWCVKPGMYIILDFHAEQGWHHENARVPVMLYPHKLFQDRFVGLWVQMATRYKDLPPLAGYG